MEIPMTNFEATWSVYEIKGTISSIYIKIQKKININVYHKSLYVNLVEKYVSQKNKT